MQQIIYREGSLELLEEVKPLWESLNQHHEVNSQHFAHQFRANSFESRQRKFLQCQQVRVDLVEDQCMGEVVAYCITTVTNDLTGEVDSLYIKQRYRNLGIGESLMTKALVWLEDNKVKKKIIGVAEGNESVLAFYQRFHFYPRLVLLEEIGMENLLDG